MGQSPLPTELEGVEATALRDKGVNTEQQQEDQEELGG